MLYTLVITFFLSSGDVYGKTVINAQMSKQDCLELSSNMGQNMKGSTYNYSLDCLPIERDTIK